MHGQQTHPSALGFGSALEGLYRAADDHEASVLRDLVAKAGHLWDCPGCHAKFDPAVASCEFCGAARPADFTPAEAPARPRVLVVHGDRAGITTHALGDVTVARINDGEPLPEGFEDFAPLLGYEEEEAPPGLEHFKVEYDLNFWGGNFTGTGEHAYVPFSLVAPAGRLTAEQAFLRHTGIDPAHVIHYTFDETYDAAGQELDDEAAGVLAEVKQILDHASLPDILAALENCCLATSGDEDENTEAWKAAAERLLQAREELVTLERKPADEYHRLLRRTDTELIIQPAGSFNGALRAGELLGHRSVEQALEAAARYCRITALRAGRHSETLRRAGDVLDAAASFVSGLTPSAGLNY